VSDEKPGAWEASKPLVKDIATGEHLGDYRIRLHSEHPTWVNFLVFEIAGMGDKPLYIAGLDGPSFTEDIEQAVPQAHGFVKWDGCTQVDITDGHFCGLKDMEGLFGVIRRAREACVEFMGDTWQGD
jgi:hypothetical protein